MRLSAGDSYLSVDGRRCSLSWGSSKSSITLNNIRDDMKVYCEYRLCWH